MYRRYSSITPRLNSYGYRKNIPITVPGLMFRIGYSMYSPS
jgi:hypothetical protein